MDFSNFTPVIDHVKVLDFISENEHLICASKKIYAKNPIVRQISLTESYFMSKRYARNKDTYWENKPKIKKMFDRHIRNDFQGYASNIYSIKVCPDLCIFCGGKYADGTEDHINLHTDGHGFY